MGGVAVITPRSPVVLVGLGLVIVGGLGGIWPFVMFGGILLASSAIMSLADSHRRARQVVAQTKTEMTRRVSQKLIAQLEKTIPSHAEAVRRGEEIAMIEFRAKSPQPMTRDQIRAELEYLSDRHDDESVARIEVLMAMYETATTKIRVEQQTSELLDRVRKRAAERVVVLGEPATIEKLPFRPAVKFRYHDGTIHAFGSPSTKTVNVTREGERLGFELDPEFEWYEITAMGADHRTFLRGRHNGTLGDW
jgi:hypothetical protein